MRKKSKGVLRVVKGVVMKVMTGSRFIVVFKLEEGGKEYKALAYISGRMLRAKIRIFEGDSVSIEIPDCDFIGSSNITVRIVERLREG